MNGSDLLRDLVETKVTTLRSFSWVYKPIIFLTFIVTLHLSSRQNSKDPSLLSKWKEHFKFYSRHYFTMTLLPLWTRLDTRPSSTNSTSYKSAKNNNTLSLDCHSIDKPAIYCYTLSLPTDFVEDKEDASFIANNFLGFKYLAQLKVGARISSVVGHGHTTEN